MQVFKEAHENRETVVLGGKLLVIDIDFAIAVPYMEVITLKTSWAVANSHSSVPATTEGSPLLDAFLKRCIDAYLEEIQGRQEPLEVERRGRVVSEQLTYLMMLDKLAAEEGGAGVKRLKEMERIAGIAEEVAKGEITGVARSAFYGGVTRVCLNGVITGRETSQMHLSISTFSAHMLFPSHTSLLPVCLSLFIFPLVRTWAPFARLLLPFCPTPKAATSISHSRT